DHAGIDVPAAKGSSLDVLRAKCLGQVNCSLDVFRISFGLDAAPLLLIEGPITVELKTTVADARPGKRSTGYRICVRDQRSHRRTLISNSRDSEIQETRKQIRPIRVCVKIHQAGNYNAASSVQHARPRSGNTARGSYTFDATLLNENVARLCNRCAGAIDDTDVSNKHRFGHRRCVRDWPADLLFHPRRRTQAKSSVR